MTQKQPKHTSPPPSLQGHELPEAVRERTARARALGLSPSETSHARTIARNPDAKRIKHMQRVVNGATEQFQAYKTRNGHRFRAAMLTLTYANAEDWRPRHISRLMQRIRDWLARRGYSLEAVWVLELQKRGAPHYHVLIYLPRGLTLPKPDKQGWWPHGHTRIEWARKPARYMAKYTSKGDNPCGALPHRARLFAIYRSPVHLGWWRAPAWMRELADQGMRITKAKGGWWRVPDLAHAWRSPWQFLGITPYGIDIYWRDWPPDHILPLWLLDKHAAMEQ